MTKINFINVIIDNFFPHCLRMRRQRVLVFFAIVLQTACAFEVLIDYSFGLPKKYGVADPKEVCCPWARLPKNNTNGMSPPTVIGIGTQKGGTSTFYVHLRAHPQLQSTNKELHYLDEAGSETYRHYLQKWPFNKSLIRHKYGRNRGGRRLLAEWQPPKLFEISPSYMFVPFAACKAKWVVPDAKFVVFLREPADRAYSGVTHETNVMSSAHGGKYKWMHRTFREHMLQGIQELILDPKCDFHTGKGKRTYNDCVGCMVRWAAVQGSCAVRPFVNLKDKSMKHSCTSIGKEHVLRGLYGAQLAWWFTMFDPSQFMIINSVTYFKDPLPVLQNITNFLGLTKPYSKPMLKRAPKKANVGHYWKVNQTMVAETKSILRQFYKRPNLELYRLLKETGHDFPPFEKYLQDKDVLNCTDPKVIESGICGAQLFGSTHSMYALLEDARVKGLENVMKERKMEKPQPVNASLNEVKFSKGVTVIQTTPEVEPKVETTKPKVETTKPEVESLKPKSESKMESTPSPPTDSKPEASGTETKIEESVSKSESTSSVASETASTGIGEANDMMQSYTEGESTDTIEHSSPSDKTDIDRIQEPTTVPQSVTSAKTEKVDIQVPSTVHKIEPSTIIYRSTNIYSTTRRPIGQLGISHSDFVIHFIFGAFLVGVSLYGFRSLRRHRRIAR